MPDPILANGSAISPDAPPSISAAGSGASPASPGGITVAGASITPASPGPNMAAGQAQAGYATATLGSTGSDNAIVFTCAFPGTLGVETSVAIEDGDLGTVAVAVGVTGSAVTITAAAMGVINFAGITSPIAANQSLYYAGTYNGKPIWSSDGVIDISTQGTRGVCYWNSNFWHFQYCVSGSAVYAASKSSVAASPVGLTGWTLTAGTTSPTVTAAASNAAQGIAAVNSAPAAAALVVAANVPGYNGHGSLAAVSATYLSGGLFLAPSSILAPGSAITPSAPSPVP